MKILFTLISVFLFVSCVENKSNKTGDFYRKCVISDIKQIKADSLEKSFVVETDCGKSIIKTTGDNKYKKGDTIIIRD
jgi:hypothetical protein